MNMQRLSLPLSVLAVMVMMIVVASCSTTSKIPDGDMLYNGLKLSYTTTPADLKIAPGVKSDVMKTINVKPNNAIPLITPYKRYPFPLGLWVYNHMSDSARGFKGWLYRNLVSEPVLIRDVKPETRAKMVKAVLDNNGYFNSSVEYEVKPRKNPKIADVDYKVEIGEPYLLDTIIYMRASEPPGIADYIDTLARAGYYLRPGERFCVDSLSSERVRITNALRNKGFYYFRPDYIEFLADSLIKPGRIAMRITMAENTPSFARKRWKTGKIYTTVHRRSTRHPGTPDTLQTTKGELVVYRPSKLRPNLIPSCITFRPNRWFSVRHMDRTQSRLSRLGIFGNIQIQPVPVDTVNPTLDVMIDCQFERPIEATIQANVTSKSNSYLGPGLILSMSNNNLFGGAERFSIQLNGSYEWQTGSHRSSLLNSYEFGLGASLAFPRLLAPHFMHRTNRELNWTTLTLNASVLNRPHYFQLAEFNGGINYEWNYSRRVTNQLTLFKLTYSKLMKTTHDFDSIMAENPAVALSFESQFIPEISYTYNYERWLERSRMNGFNFSFTVKEAGNIFWGIWRACGDKGRKTMFGTPFSQFVKGQAQLIYNRRLRYGTNQWLVARLLIGAEHAYGNSRTVPYADQFYIGGANSIRAFTARSIGPGSYRAPKAMKNGYFDQTGTFKFEVNAEYRFPLVSVLNGALFVDAGNIWLLRDDPLRPGGLLTRQDFLRDLALGTGVGLRVDLGMMVIRGDLGYGLHAPYNTGRNSYFNIAFKKAFAFHLAIGYPF